MRRSQITLDEKAFDEAALRRDLLKVLLHVDIATVESSLEDDKFTVVISLKKTLLAESTLATIKRLIISFMDARYPDLMDFLSIGVAIDGSKLSVICLFELTE